MAAIGKIRKHGVALMIIIGIALLAFIVGDFTQIIPSISNKYTIVRVGSTKIKASQGQNQYDIYYRQNVQLYRWMAPNWDQNGDDFDEFIHDMTWSQIKQETLLDKELKSVGLAFTKEMKENVITKLVNCLKQGYTNEAEYNLFVVASRMVENGVPVQQVIAFFQNIEDYKESNPDLYNVYEAIQRQAILAAKANTYFGMANNGIYFSQKLLAQMEKRKQLNTGQNSFFSFIKKDDELIRWYDREDHQIFDVCADDHCQRYQGITKASNRSVEAAVKATKGQILMYENEICDARYGKCCGGMTEEFQYCWEDTPKPYLVSFEDPYCNTSDETILKQVLNDFDQETPDFYRWTVEYSQAELSELISRKLKEDFGEIQELIPLERGKSGRIWKLKIVGTKKTFTIGKELEIRRALSESHLLSSAFEVEKQGDRFILHGKGWGHGVGLCQIGAAVMGEQGKTYDEILLFYYRNAQIKQLYE